MAKHGNISYIWRSVIWKLQLSQTEARTWKYAAFNLPKSLTCNSCMETQVLYAALTLSMLARPPHFFFFFKHTKFPKSFSYLVY